MYLRFSYRINGIRWFWAKMLMYLRMPCTLGQHNNHGLYVTIVTWKEDFEWSWSDIKHQISSHSLFWSNSSDIFKANGGICWESIRLYLTYFMHEKDLGRLIMDKTFNIRNGIFWHEGCIGIHWSQNLRWFWWTKHVFCPIFPWANISRPYKHKKSCILLL